MQRVEEETYNDLGVGVSIANGPDDTRVSGQNGVDISLPDVHIVRAQHELYNIRLCVLHPAGNVVPGNIVRLPTRVTLVISVKAGWTRAFALQAVDGTDKVDAVGEAGGCELIPDKRAPAGDFRDGVAEMHYWRMSFSTYLVEKVDALILTF